VNVSTGAAVGTAAAAQHSLAATGLTRLHGRLGRRTAALDDCGFRIPAGSVCALVGPNGAGKTTLLELAAGVDRPTSGRLTVLDLPVGAARARVAYVPQDRPLDPRLSVRGTLRLGAELNPGRWDAEAAARIVEKGDLHPRDSVGALSRGERTRLALAVALGKRPELLLLDEPMSDLDPLARHELMGTLLAHCADAGAGVLMSSHIVGELAEVCDHLLLLDGGRVRLAGPIDDLLDAHAEATGLDGPEALARHTVVTSRPSGRGTTALVRADGDLPARWERRRPDLESLVLGHLTAPHIPPLFLPPETAPAEPQR
jgi:ABC-2 type transport system ATP-binding protein